MPVSNDCYLGELHLFLLDATKALLHLLFSLSLVTLGGISPIPARFCMVCAMSGILLWLPEGEGRMYALRTAPCRSAHHWLTNICYD